MCLSDKWWERRPRWVPSLCHAILRGTHLSSLLTERPVLMPGRCSPNHPARFGPFSLASEKSQSWRMWSS